jgi:hypothetical protein
MAFDNKAVLDAKRLGRHLAMTTLVFLLIPIHDKLPGFSRLDGHVRSAEGTPLIAVGTVGVGEVETWVLLEVFCIDTE